MVLKLPMETYKSSGLKSLITLVRAVSVLWLLCGWKNHNDSYTTFLSNLQRTERFEIGL